MFEQFIGTKPVEERHRINAGALEAFLKFKILEVKQFKGGQSNPTYLISAADGRRFALRRKPPGKLLPSAHAVDREFRVIQALHPTGFPVARPHVLCEDESVIGTAFYVMDFVDGRVLWDQSLPGMSKAERGAIWDELNRVIARLHSIDYEEIGLQTFGKPGSYIERQVARWSKQYQASETEPMEAMDNLIAAKKIPMMAGVFIAPVQRSQEYDTVSGLYADYIEKIVLDRHYLTFSGLQAMRVSSGGAHAMLERSQHPCKLLRLLHPRVSAPLQPHRTAKMFFRSLPGPVEVPL